MNVIEKIFFGVLAIFAVCALYLIFILLPVAIYTDAQCLRLGYPTSHVSVGLERYCSNFTGTVTIKVDKQ